MMTSPIESTNILSIPLGPSVVRTASATALAAAMLLLCAVFPRLRVVPSLSMKIGCCPDCMIIAPSDIPPTKHCALRARENQTGPSEALLI